MLGVQLLHGAQEREPVTRGQRRVEALAQELGRIGPKDLFEVDSNTLGESYLIQQV